MINEVFGFAGASEPHWSAPWPDLQLKLRHEKALFGARMDYTGCHVFPASHWGMCGLGLWVEVNEHVGCLILGMLWRRRAVRYPRGEYDFIQRLYPKQSFGMPFDLRYIARVA